MIGPIRSRSDRTVVSYFSGAMKRGETRVRVPAWLVDQVYGKDVGRLLDRLGSWRLEGTIEDDLVFVQTDPPAAIRARWAVRQVAEPAHKK